MASSPATPSRSPHRPRHWRSSVPLPDGFRRTVPPVSTRRWSCATDRPDLASSGQPDDNGSGQPVNTTVLRSLSALLLSATAVGAVSLARASGQSGVDTITWIFNGRTVGSNTYRTLPSGRFESTSEEKVGN